MKSLADYVTNPVTTKPVGLTAVVDKLVTINDVTLRMDGKHPYAVLHLTLDDKTTLFCRTQAKHVVNGLNTAKLDKAFPLVARFVRISRQWIVK